MANYTIYTTHCEYDFKSYQAIAKYLKSWNYTGDIHIYDRRNNTTEARYYNRGHMLFKSPKFNGQHTPLNNPINLDRYI